MEGENEAVISDKQISFDNDAAAPFIPNDNEFQSSDDILNIGSYCFLDDDEEDDIYCVIIEVLPENKFRIIDFEENRERIVVKSSLISIKTQQQFEMDQIQILQIIIYNMEQ